MASNDPFWLHSFNEKGGRFQICSRSKVAASLSLFFKCYYSIEPVAWPAKKVYIIPLYDWPRIQDHNRLHITMLHGSVFVLWAFVVV